MKKQSTKTFVAGCIGLAISLVGTTRADVTNDLGRLRNSCLYYAVGHAPNDRNTRTIRQGLWAQSPFSPNGEIDLAASAFSLAGLPSAVEAGIVSRQEGATIALSAAARVSEMVAKAAAAQTPTDIAKFGYAGMLYHYYVWNGTTNQFERSPGTEVSTIDTALLLNGLLISAQYFGGSVKSHYEAARDGVDWSAWLDTNPGPHQNQFFAAYFPGTGFTAHWWDHYTHEAMLVVITAVMSDPTLDAQSLWRAWTRDEKTYTSPGPDSQTYTTLTTWFGDPFTVTYALPFYIFSRFPADIDGVNWFEEGQISYEAHREFFKKERGYLDDLVFSFFGGSTGSIAEPKSNPGAPLVLTEATVYGTAGGLWYGNRNPALNKSALALSRLTSSTPGFFGWHGWPAATVKATNPDHGVTSNFIIGQDIAFTGLAVDSFYSPLSQHLVLQDKRMREALRKIFPVNRSLLIPDVRIGLSKNHQTGDGIYQPAGAGQTINIRLGMSKATKIYYTIENDGDGIATSSSRASRSNRLLSLKYYAGTTGNRINITSQITRGAFETAGVIAVSCECDAKLTKVGRSKRKVRSLVTLTTTSSTDYGVSDQVMALIRK